MVPEWSSEKLFLILFNFLVFHTRELHLHLSFPLAPPTSSITPTRYPIHKLYFNHFMYIHICMLYYLHILLSLFAVPICTYISYLRLGMSLNKTDPPSFSSHLFPEEKLLTQ